MVVESAERKEKLATENVCNYLRILILLSLYYMFVTSEKKFQFFIQKHLRFITFIQVYLIYESN